MKRSFFESKHILAYDSINWVNLVINSIHSEWLIDTGASISAVKNIFFKG